MSNNTVYYVLAKIFLSLWLASCLSIFPFPQPVYPILPPWLLLVCLYWIATSLNCFHAGTALLVGLFADLLLNKALGVQGLSYILVTYIFRQFYIRFPNASLMQSWLIISILLLLNRLWLLEKGEAYFYVFLSFFWSFMLSLVIEYKKIEKIV